MGHDMAHNMVVTWQDFTLFGSFMFFMAVGWTFKQSYEKYTRYREKTEEEEELESVMIEQCFKRSWVEGIVVATTVIIVLLIEMIPRVEKGKLVSFDIGQRWFVIVVWLPYAFYSAVLILCDFYKARTKAWVKPSILFALLCEYALVGAHLGAFAADMDKCMYTPVCAIIYFSALVIVGEMMVPELEQLPWLRCGCSLVQGTWLVQIGCTLSMTGREWRRDEGVAFTVFVIFIWHCVLAWIVIRVLRKTVKVVSSSKPSAENAWEYFDLYSEDEEDYYYYATNRTRSTGWMKQGGIPLSTEQILAMGYKSDHPYS